MARYTGPVCRLCRRHGDALMLKGERCYTKCAFQTRPQPRLDNVVYRRGFADSRPQARQLVNHCHLSVDGRKTGIPSAHVKVSASIGWTESGKKTEYYKIVQETVKNKEIPAWLSLDMATMTGSVLRPPEPSDAGVKFDPLVIVEYYSR